MEVLENAESQFPNETKVVVDQLGQLLKSGEINEEIDGGKLLLLFRSVGINIRMQTKINIEQDGKFEDGQFDERTRSSRRRRPRESFAGVSRPLATASAAVAIAVGARLLFGAPQDAVAGVDPTIVVNGVRADWLNGEWASLGCSVVAWNVVLTAAMLVADSVAFVAVGGDDEGDD